MAWPWKNILSLPSLIPAYLRQTTPNGVIPSQNEDYDVSTVAQQSYSFPTRVNSCSIPLTLFIAPDPSCRLPTARSPAYEATQTIPTVSFSCNNCPRKRQSVS